jgi:hypothetical protein
VLVVEVVEVLEVVQVYERSSQQNTRRGREEFLTVEVVLVVGGGVEVVEVVLLVGGGVEVDEIVEDVTVIYPQGWSDSRSGATYKLRAEAPPHISLVLPVQGISKSVSICSWGE